MEPSKIVRSADFLPRLSDGSMGLWQMVRDLSAVMLSRGTNHLHEEAISRLNPVIFSDVLEYFSHLA